MCTLLPALCVLLSALTTGAVDAGAASARTGLLGDMNCDGVLSFDDINPFVLALTAPGIYANMYPECPLSNADINGDGAADFRDINPFVAWLANGPPHIGETSYGECQMPRGDRAFCDNDVVTFWVEDGVLHMLHENAEYNCCLDDVAISLSITGSVVHLEEEEILTLPCYCLCCYQPAATVVGLLPGTYTVELCWYDYFDGWTCYAETVVIP